MPEIFDPIDDGWRPSQPGGARAAVSSSQPASGGIVDPIDEGWRPTQPGSSASEDTVARTAGRLATSVPSGINKTLATIAGSPVDLPNAALRYMQDTPPIGEPGRLWDIPLVSQLIGHLARQLPRASDASLGDAAKSGLDAALNLGRDALPDTAVIRDFHPETSWERMGERIGEEIGGALPVIGASAKIAQGARKLGAFEPFVAPYRAAPTAAAATELGIATTAGAGAHAARTAVGEDAGPMTTVADLVGALAGGLAPMAAVGAGRVAARNLPAVTEKPKAWLPAGADREGRVAEAMGYKPNQQILLDEAAEAAPNIPGVQYTPGQLLDDPLLLARERGILRETDAGSAFGSSEPKANAAALRTHAENVAPEGAVEATRPAVARQNAAVAARLKEAQERATEIATERQAAAEAKAAQDLAEAQAGAASRVAETDEAAAARVAALAQSAASREARAQAAADARVAAARGETDAARSGASSGMTAEQASRVAREEIGEAKQEAKDAATALFNKVDPEGKIRLPTAHIEAARNDIVREAVRRGREDAIPEIIRKGIVDEYFGLQPMARLQGLYSRIGETIRKGAGSDMGAAELEFLGDLQKSITHLLDDMAADRLPQALAEDIRPRVLGREGELSAEDIDGILRTLRATPEELAAVRTGEAQATGTGPRVRATGEPGAVESGSGGVRATGPGEGQSGATAGREGVSGRGGQAGDLEPVLDPDATARYRVARDFFRENVADKFKRGPAKDVLAKNADGSPKVAPSDTLERFAKPRTAPGAEEAADAFVAAVGDRPAAVGALRDYMVDTMSRIVKSDGKIDANKYRDFMERYAPTLDRFPELRADMGKIADAQAVVDRLGKELPERVGAIRETMKGRVKDAESEGRAAVRVAKADGDAATAQTAKAGRAETATAKDQGRDEVARETGRLKRTQDAIDQNAASYWLDNSPENAVSAVLNSGDPVKAARNVMSTVRRDPDAVNGVRRAVWDYFTTHMFSDSASGMMKEATARRMLRENRPALRVLIGDTKLAELDKIIKANEITTRTARAVVPGGSDSAQTLLGTMTRAAGGGPLGSLISKTLGLALNSTAEAKIRAIMREAATDPEKARLLMTRVTKDNEARLARRLESHLATAGVRQAVAEREE